jgi:hypothetical protein
MTSGSQPASAVRSSLPDYYADERRAHRRVRVRKARRWVGLAVAGGILLLWQAGR